MSASQNQPWRVYWKIRLNFPPKTYLGQNCIEMQLVCRHTQTAELFITCGQKLVVNQLQHRGTESRRSQLELERWRFRGGGGGFGVARNAPKLIAITIIIILDTTPPRHEPPSFSSVATLRSCARSSTVGGIRYGLNCGVDAITPIILVDYRTRGRLLVKVLRYLSEINSSLVGQWGCQYAIP